jgi:hypothetical protein
MALVSRFLHRHPNCVALAFGGFSLLLLLVLTETTCFFLYRARVLRAAGVQTRDSIFAPHGALGMRPRPNIVRARHRLEVGGRLSFDVHYSTDRFGRRMTVVEAPERRRELALFFGCSVTWGAGVEDDQTLPAIILVYNTI